jgi:hypothetical protein
LSPRALSSGLLFWAACAVAGGLGCQLLVDTSGISDRKCPANKKPCENLQTCVFLTEAITGCGNDTCAPCALPHAFADCSADYRCRLTDCHPGFGNCNMDEEDGCETDTAHDPNRCGSCSGRCENVINGYRACSGGACVIGGCELGYEDCDGFLATGCEEAIWTDARCGGCNAAPCPAGQSCDRGTCRTAAP